MFRTEGEIELMGESGQAAAMQRERERERDRVTDRGRGEYILYCIWNINNADSCPAVSLSASGKVNIIGLVCETREEIMSMQAKRIIFLLHSLGWNTSEAFYIRGNKKTQLK